MFDSVLIRPNTQEDMPMDFGQVVESLFFYQNVTAHINRASIPLLLKLADIHVLEELLKYQGLKLLYNNSYPTVGIPGDGTYWVDTIGLSDFDIEKELYEECFRSTADETRSRKFSKKLARLIGVYELPYNVKGMLVDQLHDPHFLKSSLDETIKTYFSTNTILPANRRYELEFLSGGRFRVHTNLSDDQEIPFNDTSPVLSLINAVVDLHLMSENNSEICLPAFNSAILRNKLSSLLDKSQQSTENISRFTLAQFNESWAIREAINKKDLHVKAVLPVLRKANRFKEWLSGLPDDHDLMYEYQEKVEERTVLDRIGFKQISFYFFQVLQIIVSAATIPEKSIPINVGLSAFEANLLERMTRNWKPNQFVRGDYRRLLKK